MAYETLIYEKEDGVAIIQLNRPETMNALESKMVEELFEVTNNISKDIDVGAVILTGTSKAFCAGGDLRRMVEGFTPVEGQEYCRTIHPWVKAFANLEKPVIAAVNGFAVGAGFCIALFCDIILAAEQAKFGQAFVNVGLVPDLAGMYYLPRLVSLQIAKELVFTGKNIDAHEAHRLGIVNEVFSSEELMTEAKKLAHKLASGPRIALGQAKKILNISTNLNLESLLELEAYAQGLCFQTEDHKEAAAAFIQKRKPVFKGK